MSETVLSSKNLRLTRGEFTLESTPLVQKENFSPLEFVAAGRQLRTSANTTTSTTVSVRPEETLLTVRKGQLSGVAFPGLADSSPQAGQSLRLSDTKIFRTGHGGQELPALPLSAPRADEFGGLLADRAELPQRGLGTMTARLPNTDQVRDGVELKKHHVRVVIRDGFARTEVEEEFENTSPHVLEGRYRFPVPADASLSRLALWVGEELIEGEVLERKRAADIYRRIVDRPVPRDPALLEWVTGGEMSLKVFPIVPKKSRKVILAYNQALSTENGLLRYVYPLSLGQGRENKIEDLSITVHLGDSKAKLRNVRVPEYDARLGNEGDFKTVSLELKGATPLRDFVVLADRDVTPTAQLSAYVPSWGAGSSPLFGSRRPANLNAAGVMGHFALRLSADLPEGAERPTPQPQDRAVVIDVSQSQSAETIAAQGALAYGILREMDPSEKFILVACDSACRTFPATGPQEASSSLVQHGLQFLSHLEQGGSSDIAGALVAAAAQLKNVPREGRARQIILLSDGKASSGDLSAETIARRAQSPLAEIDADLRIIGAGRTVDEDTLRGLARDLDATYDRLQSGTALEERIFELSISLRRPVLRALSLTLPTALRSPTETKLPAIRLGQEILFTGEILDLSGGQVVLEGKLGSLPYRLTRPIEWDSSAQNPLIPRLWAQERIIALQAQEATPAVQAEIVQLSTAHRTMSRYTSFLVLENEKMYRDFGVERSTQSESDQSDAAFSQIGLMEPALQKLEARDEEALTSFEDLAEQEMTADANPPARATASKMSPRPRPAPAPAPRPKAKKPSMEMSGSGDLDGVGSIAKGASAPSTSSGAIAPSQDRFRDPLEEMPFERPVFRPPPRRLRSAHLTFVQADDEWRKWGEQNLTKLVASLRADEKSRARHEAYIRGHLKLGRFPEARRDAERFVELDPDYAPARQLLAYAAVVDGDHELSRRMLDIQAEAAPNNTSAHWESARSFEAAGDLVRACAHYRAVAELAPQLSEATQRASTCWDEVLGRTAPGSTNVKEGEAGQLQIDVKCDAGVAAQDCPSPVVIAPDGSIVSPWTPGAGRSSRSRISFVKLRSGDYFILVLGGAPQAQGTVTLTGRLENQAFKFRGGGMHTVAKATVSFW